jgi:hypothetical protein
VGNLNVSSSKLGIVDNTVQDQDAPGVKRLADLGTGRCCFILSAVDAYV